jgi:hypothetical protein
LDGLSPPDGRIHFPSSFPIFGFQGAIVFMPVFR